jgi:fluoroquinolone transport system permease protein
MIMISLKSLRALGRADALSISRDSLLRGMVLVPLGLAVGARWLFPPAIVQIGALLHIDLQALYPLFMSYVLLLLAPAICGMVVGFMLLDQRDDGTLAALQVTPLPLAAYLVYRLAAPMLLSLAMTLLALPIAGLVALRPLELLLLALSAAPLAPLCALFLGAFAANKVQGFALQKALGVFMLGPFIGSLLPAPLNLLVGLLPTYWPAALIWALADGAAYTWLLLPLGLAYQGALLWGLLRRFRRIVSS